MTPVVVDTGSGGRTFDDLQTEALGNDFAAGVFPGSRVGQYLNDGVHRIARRVHIPKLEMPYAFSTIPGTAAYDLPVDDIRILSASNVNDRAPLEELDIHDIDDLTLTTGNPVSFAQSGGQLVLFPTPDHAYQVQIRYLRNTVFTAGTDTTTDIGFPDDYSDLLVLWARARMFRFEDDLQAAGALKAEFETELANLKNDVQRQSPSRVRQVGDWRYGRRRLPYQVP
jgi:hypothetical protein